MLDLRITYTSEEELDILISTLKEKYSKVIINPKRYKNDRYGKTNEYRVYIKVEI